MLYLKTNDTVTARWQHYPVFQQWQRFKFKNCLPVRQSS